MQNTKIGTTWAPDIRPDSIEIFEEEAQDGAIVQYKAVDNHPVLNRVLDKMAFFKTHAGAVWYNLAERKTLLAKIKEQDEEIAGLNAKMDIFSYKDITMDIIVGGTEVPGITGLNYIPVIKRVSSTYEDIGVHGFGSTNKWIVISKHAQNITIRFFKYPDILKN